MHAGIPPWVWVWSPLTRCGPGIPPTQARPLSSPQCGPGDSRVWAWRPPRCGPGDHHPPGVGLETPPRPGPSTSPPDVGLETCMACWDTTPLLETCKACWDTTCKACWDTTCNACWDTTPPWTDRHV